ncbi:MAG: hypothetical protein WC097_01615 [Eubacteriales bacterium]
MAKRLFTPTLDVSSFIKEKNARKKVMRAIDVAINLQARGKELLQRRWTIGELHALDKARKAEGYPPMYFSEEDC